MSSTTQDFKIYGKEYDCYIRGKFIGKAIWTDDENIGDAFLKEAINKQGESFYHVFRPDEWYFSLN